MQISENIFVAFVKNAVGLGEKISFNNSFSFISSSLNFYVSLTDVTNARTAKGNQHLTQDTQWASKWHSVLPFTFP